ncbi:MAG TPA: preprotein translocase subunit SecA [Acidimicrobiales bacterium]|nr:preprotein translocase subunit SecA [Acidimicrobiales bacterium]
MSVLTKFLRIGEGKKLRALQALVPDINALESELEALSDEDIAHKTVEFRERLANGQDLNDLLTEAFAVVREAAKRTIGQRHYDVQLMGGACLHFGWIAEMKTGEGKTLVSTLPVYLNALEANGVHVVTVNDYLAGRDADWMGKVHRFLGLTVGRVSPDFPEWDDKKYAYNCDITYGTNTEFGFDYLRDNMARDLDHMVQRGHHFAIVDEVDSILIDEARTPLIIAGPSSESARLYYQFAGVARSLARDEHYEVDEEKRTVVPTEEGIAKVESLLGLDNLYDLGTANLVHQLTVALKAKELYKRDKDYLVADGEVKIVDEFTGRVLEGRRWSDGIHQAVEAKERVQIKEENHTWATVTLQNYFRLYDKLAGMTGTAVTEASEFGSTYHIQVVAIPTNLPMIREDYPDLIYRTEKAKFNAVVDDVIERYEKGQPVLVGTASVEKSEVLSRQFTKRGIPHQVLNAKQHAREAAIIAQAGRLHSVTVATNMAGRGVDILLGGNPEGLALESVRAEGLDPTTEEGTARYNEVFAKYKEECAAEGDQVRELGGLYVLGSERHEARRVDDQLRGRSGRQGDPGESRFFLSLEDELMRLFAQGMMQWAMGRFPEDMPIENRMVTRAIERAQHNVEIRNAEIRKDTLKYDEVMNEQRKVIYARRIQVMEGEDLRQRTIDTLTSAVDSIIRAHCPSEFREEWDLDGLLSEVRQYLPTQLSVESLKELATTDAVYESIIAEAIEYYEKREASMPAPPDGDPADTMRQLEREVMLQLMDQRWREHLSEMDYLREGIYLRSLGQKDPLTEWQRDGYEMFGQLMSSIDDDYVKYVMHTQVQVQERPAEPNLSGAQYLGPEAPVLGSQAIAGALAQGPVPGEELVFASDEDVAAARNGATRAAPMPSAAAMAKSSSGASEFDNVGRNDPCPCGSGKKFKFCHGK